MQVVSFRTRYSLRLDDAIRVLLVLVDSVPNLTLKLTGSFI